MKFSCSSSSRGERIGKVEVTKNGCPLPCIETPTVMTYTRAGAVPHIMASVINRLNNCEWFQFLSLSTPSLIEQPGIQVIQEYPGSLPEFLGIQSCVSYLSVQDTGNSYREDAFKYNEEKTVSVWTQSGRKKLTPEEYMGIVAVFQVDIFESLCDTVPAEESVKRCKKSVDRSLRFMDECLDYMKKNKEQFCNSTLLGVIEGGDSKKERQRSAVETSKRDPKGFVLQGFDRVKENWENLLKATMDCLPTEKVKFLPGALTPDQILFAIGEGVDIFDSSLAYQLCEQGRALWLPMHPDHLAGDRMDLRHDGETSYEKSEGNLNYFIDLNHIRYKSDLNPFDNKCDCYACVNHTRAYVHHLLVTKEMLARVLLMLHNLQRLWRFLASIREAISTGQFEEFRESTLIFLRNPESPEPDGD